MKSDGIISVDQFKRANGELQVKVGDTIKVLVESVADDFGETRLSYEKAKRAAMWNTLTAACEAGTIVTGHVSNRIKGGFAVDIDGVRAFLPGSLIDVKPVSDTESLIGTTTEFKVIKVDEKRNNIVVSRRAVLEEKTSQERSKALLNLEEGQVIKGVVKNLTDYGAFVDLGGVDGLLHITDIAWKRVKHPRELLKVGQEVEVVILKFDRDKSRISLGMKQLHGDPWSDVKNRYTIGQKLSGKVTNLTDYGCFVELETGVEGLVHMSEMDWTNKNIHPNKLVKPGQVVDVVVLDVDQERRRISLGMKQAKENPWQAFAEHHKTGEHIKGVVKSITDFGLFIGLDGGIDGLVHLSDIAWDQPGEAVITNYKKGDEVEAIIMGIEPLRERIALGIKQLQPNPFGEYLDAHQKNSIVKGRVIAVDEQQATLELADQITGILPVSEFATTNSAAKLNEELKIGDEIEVKMIGADTKDHIIHLSTRSMKEDKPKNNNKPKAKKVEKMAAPTLGDILKQQMTEKS